MKLKSYIVFVVLICKVTQFWAQHNKTTIVLNKIASEHTFDVTQKIIFYNNSNDVLNEIKLLDWNHSFSDRNSPLGKRFLENYEKKFQFTIEKNKGNTFIKNILIESQSAIYYRENPQIDIVVIPLNQPLYPHEQITIDLEYRIKLPNKKFTGFGFDNNYYHLKYWYLIPAVYHNGWQTLSNLDLDDQYHSPIDFEIELQSVENYAISSNLNIQKKNNTFLLQGNARLNAEIVLSTENKTEDFTTDFLTISTDLKTFDLDQKIRQNILNRQLLFLSENLGKSQVDKIFITQELYNKYPIYGLNQLPGFLRPFSDTFEWDIRMFQTLTKVYLQENLNLHPRNNSWLQEGLVPYLMMQYVAMYYPDNKLIGNISKIWGVKFYHFAELNFNDRYLYGYQSIARSNNDQAITTQTDQLSNYNRLVGTRFKTALALQYLDHYLSNGVVSLSIREFYNNNTIKSNNQTSFRETVISNTSKPTEWFFDSYIHSDKNIDFQLKKPEKEADSLLISYKTNYPNYPVLLNGWQKNIKVSEYWLMPTDKENLVKVTDNNEDKWILNADQSIAEVRFANNWQYTYPKFFRKPLQLRWFSDVENPYKNQIFLEPKFYYNYYDGIIISGDIHNKTFFRKHFYYKLSPSVGLKSADATGSFSLRYMNFPEKTKINNYVFGLSGNYSLYAPELAYKSFSAYAALGFKRKSFRSPENKGVSISYTMIDKEIDPNIYYNPDAIKYGIFNVNYTYSRPELINKLYWTSNWEIGKDFSKMFTDIRFRKLTNSNQQFEVRGFLGFFIYNNATTDYYSFATNRPTDYLFRYPYFGRSETNGIFSQQFIMNEGGFKSEIPLKYANQWLASINTSIGLWRWFEIYTDVGWAKNNNNNVYFIHDKGIRFNFVNDYLEVYFPLHSNNGWETATPHYEEKIRIVFTANMKEVWSYIKRGFF